MYVFRSALLALIRISAATGCLLGTLHFPYAGKAGCPNVPHSVTSRDSLLPDVLQIMNQAHSSRPKPDDDNTGWDGSDRGGH